MVNILKNIIVFDLLKQILEILLFLKIAIGDGELAWSVRYLSHRHEDLQMCP